MTYLADNIITMKRLKNQFGSHLDRQFLLILNNQRFVFNVIQIYFVLLVSLKSTVALVDGLITFYS